MFLCFYLQINVFNINGSKLTPSPQPSRGSGGAESNSRAVRPCVNFELDNGRRYVRPGAKFRKTS